MRKPSIYWVAIPLVTLFACGQYNREAATPEEVTLLQSEARKRIRSADVRCRVPDVFKAASTLERMVVSVEGVVVESVLHNDVTEQRTLPWSADSLKLVKRYTPVANLTLRVPVKHLDSVVSTLTSMAGFIDYRKLQDQDVTLAYERNAMKNEALAAEDHKRETTHTKMNKELEVTQHQEANTEAAIDRTIANLGMLENAAFSTISVQLFQPEVADVQVVVNPQQLTRAGFGTAAMNALRGGADVFRALALFILQVWPLWVLAAAGWVLYRKVLRRYSGLKKI
ncbi:DUF4349 domain-containing protein [Chitinophaga sp.]|uniref:DUF4349 domain-containing protein n=1 Tax=Chitinophaga sp. TaxID=1869181 RepID=UPI0031D7D964